MKKRADIVANKICQLDERKICDDCKECLYCDLDPEKLCNDCCKCLDEADYRAIKIIRVITDEKEAAKYRKSRPAKRLFRQ
ncbi:MAG: hypothetical protein NUV48_09490 [Peptococcaceae bacterium]|nr:hypothetical protein [Peptococcaceae bacterium]